MQRWELELPKWITGHIGYCLFCNSKDELIFVLEDSRGRYEHCMNCSHEWSLEKQ